MPTQLAWLDLFDTSFPDTSNALNDPNGLLAVGGDLSVPRLINAYQQGIFPWFSEGQPLLWWTPDPRMVLFPKAIHINRSLRKFARKHPFVITVDKAFESVIQHCAKPRSIEGKIETGTWITSDIEQAYIELHREGIAHSIEAWQDGTLVGGLYGVALGKVFFGESMFSRISGASKIAFATLTLQLNNWGYQLIDCQMHSRYLASFGATEIPRRQFEALLKDNIDHYSLEIRKNGVHTFEDWQRNWSMPEHGLD